MADMVSALAAVSDVDGRQHQKERAGGFRLPALRFAACANLFHY